MKELQDLKLYGIKSRQKYLEDTDKDSLKALERGEVLDPAIKDKRQLARDEISLIRDATEFSEIEHLTQEF